jgi:heavy metal sensor kinase
MIFHSIRWRLQIWYGLILVAVLAGFGITAYQLQRAELLRRVDDELHGGVNALANRFRLPPRGRGPDEGPIEGRPPDQFRPAHPPGPQGPGQPFDDGGPGTFPPPQDELHLPLRGADLFDTTRTNALYYVLLAPDGRELTRSTNAPADVPLVARANFRPNRPPRPGDPTPPPPAQMRGEFREVQIVLPPGRTLLVGRSIAPELNELRLVAWTLAAVGGVILLLGFAGGWWLASRAIRPIEDISAAAVKIAGGDLSQRVNVRDTENELGRLANVLNSTFARLEAAFSQQQQFTSDAAHELRTPISVMLTQTQTALNRERSAVEYRETVESCERAAQRMRRLIESLLELARLDAGQEPMKRAAFDLAGVAADCAELVRPLAAAREIMIHTDLTNAPCQGDADRIAQVITNLLINAVHHNQHAGEVRIVTRSENNFAILTVTDTGPGIAPEHLPRVFERFYRTDPARTASQGRAGLGLAISKAIVDAHGGSIEVSSPPGAGATFTVRLPS